MTDEERQRAMDFIVEQQAKFSVDIEQLNESYRKAEGRFDRDERILKLMIRAGRRARQHMREHDLRFLKQMAVVNEKLSALADAGAHTDRRLDALIDIVREDRNGRR
ncbi:MAG TPA: hypothetical protein VEM96_12105 [Pyrinomonadaceae bacterium]|nr:hypothetical protein [Pyrinomonadaceae bacterium]